jgi:hypothetical protein
MLVLVFAPALLAVSGCDLVTTPDLLQDFDWVAVENPDNIQEGIDAAVLAGDVQFLGQLRTPSLCYKLSADFNREGQTLNIRVDAASSNSPTCAQSSGGFRYTGALRNLGSGSYTFRVIHAVAGQTEKVYTKSLEIR